MQQSGWLRDVSLFWKRRPVSLQRATKRKFWNRILSQDFKVGFFVRLTEFVVRNSTTELYNCVQSLKRYLELSWKLCFSNNAQQVIMLSWKNDFFQVFTVVKGSLVNRNWRMKIICIPWIQKERVGKQLII